MTAATLHERSEAERLVGTLELSNLVIGLVAIVVTHLAVGMGPLLGGVVAGAAMGVINLRGMVWLTRRIIHAEKRSRRFYAILFAGKLVLVCTAIWLVLSYLPIEPLGVVIGLSSLLPATLFPSLKKSLRPCPKTDESIERRMHHLGRPAKSLKDAQSACAFGEPPKAAPPCTLDSSVSGQSLTPVDRATSGERTL